jgi:hypothetical protein
LVLVIALGVLVKGVFLALSLPSSSAWVSESWFLPASLEASAPYWKHLPVSFSHEMRVSVCTLASVFFVFFFSLFSLRQEYSQDSCNQSIWFLLVCTFFFFSIRLFEVFESALLCSLNILISFPTEGKSILPCLCV